MKLREFLKEGTDFGRDTKFIIGRFVLLGAYSGKRRYDNVKNSEKTLNRYLDCEVEGLDSEIELDYLTSRFAESAIVIYISDYNITMEEQKAKRKEEQK